MDGLDAGRRDLERAITEFGERFPREIAPLARVAYNYRWSWTPGAAALFRQMHPLQWRRSRCNPRGMIEKQAPYRLRELAADPAYVGEVRRVARELEADLGRPNGFPSIPPERPVAYFCAEFGGHCSLPLYSGGLGVLAGDFVKAASDLALPLVAVSLFYRQGYFHQRLDRMGRQVEYWIPTEIETLPAALVTGDDDHPLTVSLELRGRRVQIQIWRIDFGRVPVYLLDTDRDDNDPIDRWITSRLYDGDRQTRLAQYAVLGCGGMRALRALGIEPGLVHMNEGHAALCVFERIGALRSLGWSIADALAKVRDETVFTTHTPVAAGNEGYDDEEVEPVLGALRDRLGIDSATFYDLGRPDDSGEKRRIALTPLALRASRDANAVSLRHAEVAREMWQALWRQRPADGVPIACVTNAVHATSWMSNPMQALLDRHMAPDWRQRVCDPSVWDAIEAVPDADLWEVRGALRQKLVHEVRERAVTMRLARGEPPAYVEAAELVFHPDALTIGFARRVATYKRLHLLTLDLERGLRLLSDPDRPVQMVIAGKAHPADEEAKRTLRQVFQLRREPHVGSRIVFLEDYDMHLATRLVAGVDVWLNLPRPPLEASGTSGMKVALNGGLNLSVLDGWWAEAYDGESGWAFATEPGDAETQDRLDAAALYNILENEVAPLFYDRNAAGVPERWIRRIKTSMRRLVPRFCAERMVRDYVARIYAAKEGPARLDP